MNSSALPEYTPGNGNDQAEAIPSTQLQTKEDTLVVIPTYNETANLRVICSQVLALGNHIHVLIVDDNSPDGTGWQALYLSRLCDRISVLIRRGPRGLGAAYMAGFRWGLRRKYGYFIQMDADGSHDPTDIPRLLRSIEGCDLVIGSRYCLGGRTENWPWRRRLLSIAANVYARFLLRAGIRDLTGGFKCWRREVLERIDFARLRCNGYGFQVEMNLLGRMAGFRIREIPITFHERNEGNSKMSREIAREAAHRIAGLASVRWRPGGQHPALVTEPCQGRSASPERILAMCLGGIGDTVLAFAMLRQLRQRYPEAHLTALAMWPQSADLLRDLGIFDCVDQFCFQQELKWKSLLKVLRLFTEGFDLSLLAFPANRWQFSVLAWLIHAKTRVGHSYAVGSDVENLRWLLTDRVSQKVGTHNIDENLKLLTLLPGGRNPLQSEDVDIRLGPIAPAYHRYAQDRLSILPGPFVGIHAGSSTFKNMDGKRWSAERFAELGERLFEELGLLPLLFGGPVDRDINQAIVDRCPIAQRVETPSIRHTGAMIQRCSLFVSNDSALSHVALALDVPTVTLCGPTDPAEIGPYGRNGLAVWAGLACSPCYRVSGRSLNCSQLEPWACMKAITINAALRRCRELMQENHLSRPVPQQQLSEEDNSCSSRSIGLRV